MSKDILGSLVRVLVTVPEDRLGLVIDITNKLAGQDGDEWEKEGKRFLRRQPCWRSEIHDPTLITPKSKPELLIDLIGTVTIAATASKFIARDRFVVDTSHHAEVKISAVWDNFTAWFLSGDGKIENPISKQTLRYGKLRKATVDGPIISSTLGGEKKAETTLTEMFSLMEKQKNGEDGVLLNNGWANIFYIRDRNGVLRAVYVYWIDDGWDVSARSVEYPARWNDGYQVFSRNSLKPLEPLAPAQA
jgi:hypothetical protein